MTEVEQIGPAASRELRLARLDRESGELLHEQVAAAIRRAIADGEARPGERIPHAKDLAAVMGVNTNTVLRAIRVLREEGLLEAGRGKAITVTGTPEQGILVGRINDLLALGQRLGYPKDELVSMIKAMPGPA